MARPMKRGNETKKLKNSVKAIELEKGMVNENGESFIDPALESTQAIDRLVAEAKQPRKGFRLNCTI